MDRYTIDWDFCTEDKAAYDAKSKAATAFCEDKLKGIQISKSAWMIDFEGGLRALGLSFYTAIKSEGGFKLKRRTASGELKGDRFNICEIGRSFHSDRVVREWRSWSASLLRELEELEEGDD